MLIYLVGCDFILWGQAFEGFNAVGYVAFGASETTEEEQYKGTRVTSVMSIVDIDVL